MDRLLLRSSVFFTLVCLYVSPLEIEMDVPPFIIADSLFLNVDWFFPWLVAAFAFFSYPREQGIFFLL